MKILDPKTLNEHYNALFRNADLEGLIDLYGPNAILFSAPGRQLKGHAQIREQMKALLTLQGTLEASQLSCMEQDDLAMLHARWSFKGNDAAGNKIDIGGVSSKVARRGPDGAWRYVFDLPFVPS